MSILACYTKKCLAKIAENPEEAEIIVEDGINKKLSLKGKKFETEKTVIQYEWVKL